MEDKDLLVAIVLALVSSGYASAGAISTVAQAKAIMAEVKETLEEMD